MLAFALTIMGAASYPSVAHADELEDLQQAITQTNEEYQDLTKQITELEDKISQNQNRIEILKSEIELKKDKALGSMKTLYKFQQNSSSLLELILSSDSFTELLSLMSSLGFIQERYLGVVEDLNTAVDELKDTQKQLNDQMQEVQNKQAEAKKALDNAIAARQDYQAKLQAQIEAEAAASKQALEAVKEEVQAAEETHQEVSTFTTQTGATVQTEVPAQADPPASVDWTESRDSFVDTWAERIDAYLAGSPLAGYGRTFAEAAWDTGADPRFSPAISAIESSKGLYTFRSHNAWGWGQIDWPDWDTAIRAHVKGLAAGYGGQLTLAGAKKYCPPNWQHWYSSVLAEMQRI